MNVSALLSLPLLQPQTQSVQPGIGTLAKSSIGPEVTVTLSDEAIASATTKESAPQSWQEKYEEYLEKATTLLRKTLGIPQGDAVYLDGAGLAVVDELAKENGLVRPTGAPEGDRQITDWDTSARESTGVIGAIGCTAGDPDFKKSMYLAFNRKDISNASSLKLATSSQDNENRRLSEKLDDVLNHVQSANLLAVPANQIKRFSVISGSGGTVGTIMSLGLDTLAQEQGASMLSTIAQILQRSERA